MFDSFKIPQDFPILTRSVHGKPLVYLDNAATSQKPTQVIDAIADYYRTHNANVHRGVHQLSDESTKLWEDSRATIARFFGADPEELILVRNTTEAINGIRHGWAESQLKAKDVVLLTLMEHHSNVVAWQQVCQKVGAKLAYAAVDQTGRLDLADLSKKVQAAGPKLRLVALTHVSNTLGTHNPLQKIIEIVKKNASPLVKPRILVDGAQSAPHLPINFHQLDIDFFVFSGHKMLGPMGVGGLLVRKQLLEDQELKPWLFGGGMISEVACDATVFQEDLAELYTAGTPDAASAVGLAAACDYLADLGMSEVAAHDQELVQYALEQLSLIKAVQIIGPLEAEHRVGSVAFLYQGVHAHDVAQILDSEGVAVRSGHHCTMPLHTHFDWQATVRASFQVYNSRDDIDALISGLHKVKQVFSL